MKTIDSTTLTHKANAFLQKYTDLTSLYDFFARYKHLLGDEPHAIHSFEEIAKINLAILEEAERQVYDVKSILHELNKYTPTKSAYHEDPFFQAIEMSIDQKPTNYLLGLYKLMDSLEDEVFKISKLQNSLNQLTKNNWSMSEKFKDETTQFASLLSLREEEGRYNSLL